MNAKELYRILCQSDANIPIFSKDWWLDAVADMNGWDVDVIQEHGTIVASIPYVRRKKIFFEWITMPQLTQTLGVWVRYPKGQSHRRKLSYEEEIYSTLIEKLPHFNYFDQNFHYSMTNWLPFFWNGFKQTTRYTYVIDDLSDTERVFSNFSKEKRYDIRKAQTMVEVGFDLSAREFYETHKLHLAKNGKKINYSFELFQRIYQTSYKHDAGRVIYAKDTNGNIHSAMFTKLSPYNWCKFSGRTG